MISNNIIHIHSQNAAILEYAEFIKDRFDQYFRDAVIDNYVDPVVRRQLLILKEIGTSVLDNTDLTELNAAKNRMQIVYNSAKICPFENQSCDLDTEGLTLDPDIESILATSTNFEELQWAWDQWHDKSGKEMRQDYQTYVELMNKAALANGKDKNSLLTVSYIEILFSGYPDAGEMWRQRYEDSALVDKVDALWLEVEPLYSELHKYVRYQLLDLYGEEIDKTSNLIPAHLLGNMWVRYLINRTERSSM